MVALRLQRFDSLRPWRHRFLASKSLIHVVKPPPVPDRLEIPSMSCAANLGRELGLMQINVARHQSVTLHLRSKTRKRYSIAN
jgi:hypothetical protein